MNITPLVWNSVIAGKWNPAILTPKGIGQHIFKLAENTPMDVMVPLNALGPPRVKFDEFIVTANFERLMVDCENSNMESLDKSREYCRNAIEELPRTPFSAVGFNIRHKVEDPVNIFLDLVKPKLDDSISDSGIEIATKETRRSLIWKDGNINLHILREESGDYQIVLNFDKKSADGNILKDWLNIPIEEVEQMHKMIMCSILKICEEDQA